MSLNDLTQKPSPKNQPKPRRSLAWLLPLGLVIGFLSILGILFGSRLLPATPVKTAPVIAIRTGNSTEPTPDTNTTSNQPSTLLFQASGWVEPDPYPIFVPVLIDGIIDQVHVLEGQEVKKDQLLATLIPDDAKLAHQAATQRVASYEKKITAHCLGFEITNAQIAAANRKIEALQTQLEQARDTSTRLNRLGTGAASQQEITQARLATQGQAASLAEARAEIPRLQARLTQIESERQTMTAELAELTTLRDTAKLALDRTRITSPMNGTVLHLHVAPGTKRMLGMDDPKSAVIVELYDPEKLQARIDVPLNEAAALTTGQPVELISEILPDQKFTAIVTRIVGQADLQRNTLQAKVQINNPDRRLRPDMLVRAKFFSPSTSQSGQTSTQTPGRLSLYIPETALLSETSVWVVTPESTAEKRPITLGPDRRENHRQVLQGLRPGENVILPPHLDLQEGDRVKPTNPSS